MSDGERQLKPANQNPWYVLMTLYGEQDGEFIDRDLHNLNRAAWNAWACKQLPAIQIAEIAKYLDLDILEFNSWSEWQKELPDRFETVWRERNPNDPKCPSLPAIEADAIDLNYTEFESRVVISGFVLSNSALFSDAQFHQEIVCNRTIFLGTSWFPNATHNSDVNFVGAMFSNITNFNGVRYYGEVDFTLSIFAAPALFGSCIFHKDLSFHSSKKMAQAFFQDCHFHGNADFSKAEFNSSVGFKRARFFDFVTFENCIFRKSNSTSEKPSYRFEYSLFHRPVSFINSEFSDSFPNFIGSTFQDQASFSAEPFAWPNTTEQNSEEARASCAVIRHAVAKQGLPEDEHFFYRKEMHFAGQIGGLWQRLPYLVFGWLSDYGYSIAKPAKALLYLWALGFAAFWGYFFLENWDNAMGTAIALSLNNIIPVFGFGGQYFDKVFMEPIPDALKALSGISRILGFVFLFFLGLGLRTRFRLR